MPAPLQIYTARISYGGSDRLDVTRAADSPFAPSWDLLRQVKRMHIPNEAAWQWYVDRYTEEMRRGYVADWTDWDNLLRREPLLTDRQVTLVCYCVDPKRCHRTVLAGLLVRAGERLELPAVYKGER